MQNQFHNNEPIIIYNQRWINVVEMQNNIQLRFHLASGKLIGLCNLDLNQWCAVNQHRFIHFWANIRIYFMIFVFGPKILKYRLRG